MTDAALGARERAVAALAERRFDLLVIGGGIVGAAIAAQAARASHSVALVDRGDFASGTSSASSKLIHGGLRYLQLGDFRLVHEAHRERRLLTETVAPHLVRRTPFLLPLYEDGPHPALVVHAGLVAYAALARSRLHRPVSPARARSLVPPLRTAGLRSCGLYADAVTNDARLCLANVQAAHAAGAVVLNYASVEELRLEGGRVVGAEVAVDGEPVTVAARAVVNAAGPWVDELRRLEDPAAAPSVRLSKGVHLTLALDEPWEAAVATPQDGARVSFAVPWEGMLLLGTTDSEHDGPPGPVEATDAEVDQVLEEARVSLEPSLVRKAALRWSFAGLRVLPRGGGDTASVRREAVLSVGRGGMLTIAGGKLTTYRALAARALRELERMHGLRPSRDDRSPLPGAVDPAAGAAELARRHPDLDRSTVEHLVHLYGSVARDVLAPADESPELLERIHPDAPELVAQVAFAGSHEWALHPDDILRRRTTLAARGLDTPAVRERVAQLLAAYRRSPAALEAASST